MSNIGDLLSQWRQFETANFERYRMLPVSGYKLVIHVANVAAAK